MTEAPEVQAQEDKKVEKTQEYNFAQLRKTLEAERKEREKLQQQLESLQNDRKKVQEDEDDEVDVYVDNRRLQKELGKYSEKVASEATERAHRLWKQERELEKQKEWLESNPDFEEILGHANELALRAPNTAKSILKHEGDFAKQQAAYYAIKEMGLHKKEEKSSIQKKIDSNRRPLYYSPTDVSGAPFGGAQFDSSQANQKKAYEQMQALKNRLRGF